MSHELLYTSSPQGLKPGSRGFCTVLATKGLPAPLAQAVEGLSGYRPIYAQSDERARRNPVVYSHLKMQAIGRTWHVLSRIADFGLDYSQRPNKLAHHVILDSRAEQLPGGPANLLSSAGFMRETWDGEPTLVPPKPVTREPRVHTGICEYWKEVTGDAGWAGVVAESFLRDPDRLVILLFEPGQEILPLFAEVLSLLPVEKRWDVTFSTYFTALVNGTTCNWRAMVRGSKEAHDSLKYVDALRVDLTDCDAKVSEERELVSFARTGAPHFTHEESHQRDFDKAENDSIISSAHSRANVPPAIKSSKPPSLELTSPPQLQKFESLLPAVRKRRSLLSPTKWSVFGISCIVILVLTVAFVFSFRILFRPAIGNRGDNVDLAIHDQTTAKSIQIAKVSTSDGSSQTQESSASAASRQVDDSRTDATGSISPDNTKRTLNDPAIASDEKPPVPVTNDSKVVATSPVVLNEDLAVSKAPAQKSALDINAEQKELPATRPTSLCIVTVPANITDGISTESLPMIRVFRPRWVDFKFVSTAKPINDTSNYYELAHIDSDDGNRFVNFTANVTKAAGSKPLAHQVEIKVKLVEEGVSESIESIRECRIHVLSKADSKTKDVSYKFTDLPRTIDRDQIKFVDGKFELELPKLPSISEENKDHLLVYDFRVEFGPNHEVFEVKPVGASKGLGSHVSSGIDRVCNSPDNLQASSKTICDFEFKIEVVEKNGQRSLLIRQGNKEKFVKEIYNSTLLDVTKLIDQIRNYYVQLTVASFSDDIKGVKNAINEFSAEMQKGRPVSDQVSSLIARIESLKKHVEDSKEKSDKNTGTADSPIKILKLEEQLSDLRLIKSRVNHFKELNRMLADMKIASFHLGYEVEELTDNPENYIVDVVRVVSKEVSTPEGSTPAGAEGAIE